MSTHKKHKNLNFIRIFPIFLSKIGESALQSSIFPFLFLLSMSISESDIPAEARKNERGKEMKRFMRKNGTFYYMRKFLFFAAMAAAILLPTTAPAQPASAAAVEIEWSMPDRPVLPSLPATKTQTTVLEVYPGGDAAFPTMEETIPPARQG